MLANAEPGRWLSAQQVKELVGAEFGSGRHVDGPGEVIARHLQLDRAGGFWFDAALHDYCDLEGGNKRIHQALDSRYGWRDIRQPVDAQRDLVGDLRNGMAAIPEPDGPVVVLPGWYALQDCLTVEAMLCPLLLPDPFAVRPNAAFGGVSVGGHAHQRVYVVR